MLGPLFQYAQEKRRQIEGTEGDARVVLQQDAGAIDAYYDAFVTNNAPQQSDDDPREKNRSIREHFHNIHASLDRRLDPSTRPSALSAAESVLRLYWAYHNNLSGYRNAISSADDAIRYLDKAAGIFRINSRINENAFECKYYIGNILWLRGDPDEARPYLEEALASDATSPNIKYACKRAFAHIESKAGDIRRATGLYEEVAKEAVQIGDHECALKCQTGLIDAYRKLEWFDKADAAYEALQEQLPSMALSIQGNILVDTGLSCYSRKTFCLLGRCT